MPSTTGLQFLRPYLSKDISISRKSIYIRFFNTTRCHASRRAGEAPRKTLKNAQASVEINKDRGPIEERIKELEKGNALRYPRIQSQPLTLTVAEYRLRYGSMAAGQEKPDQAVSVYGMFQQTSGIGYGLMDV
jgi:hypothetical protein